MRKASPLSSPPIRGPRFAEIFFSPVYMRTLQPCKPGQVWSRGIVMIFLAERNSKWRPNIMSIFNELCSSLLFSQLYSVVLLWKLNQKPLYTLFFMKSLEKISTEAQEMRITGKIKRAVHKWKAKNLSFEIHLSPTLYSKREFINDMLYVLRILSKAFFLALLLSCWNGNFDVFW